MTTKIIVFVTLLCLSITAMADSWKPPSPRAVVSPTGTYLARIEPGQYKTNSTPCQALIYKYDSSARDYILIKELSLKNPVLPVSAVIRDDGKYLVTFDDYFSMGYGDNIIVIYDLAAQSIVHIKLEDFLSKSQIDSFTRSISSRHWRGDVNLMLEQRYIYIAPAVDFHDEWIYPGFILDLNSKVVNIDQRVHGVSQKIIRKWWEIWK